MQNKKAFLGIVGVGLWDEVDDKLYDNYYDGLDWNAVCQTESHGAAIGMESVCVLCRGASGNARRGHAAIRKEVAPQQESHTSLQIDIENR